MNLNFPNFKKYALFIINNHLDSLIEDLIVKVKEADVPIFKLLSHLSHDELFELSKDRFSKDVLIPLIEEKPFDSFKERIEIWKKNNAIVPKEQIEVLDITSLLHLRKACLIDFIRFYTIDKTDLIELFKEIELYFFTSINLGLKAYEEIQRGALIEKDKMLTGILSNLPVIVTRINKEGAITHAIGNGMQRIGLKNNETVGMDFLTNNPEHAKQIKEAYEGKSVSFIGKWKKNERLHYFESFFFPEDMEQHSIIGFSLDITERVEAQEELNQIQKVNEQRVALSNLFKQVPALIAVLKGKEGRVELFNPSFEKLWGFRDVVGKTMREAWPELEGQGYFELVESVFSTGIAVFKTEFPAMLDRNNTGKLEQAYFNFIYQPVYNSNEEIEGVMIFGIDVTYHVEARKQLEESEERFKTVINNAPIIFWSIDIKGIFTLSEGKGLEGIGLKPGELVGKSLFDYYKDFPNALIPVKKALKGETMTSEIEIAGKFFQTLYSPLKDESGNITGIVAISTDITEGKNAEIELKQSEERFSRIFNQTSVGIAQTDLTGKFILVNNRYVEIVGRSKEELYQMSLYDITHPEDLPGNIPLLERTAKEGIPFKKEKRYIKPDGSIVWVNIDVSAVKDTEGKTKYILGVCQDVTESKQTEEALKESDQRFRTMADNISQLAWMADEKGQRFWYNQRWYDYTGTSLEEMKDWGWKKVHHPDHVKRVVNTVKLALEKGEPYELEFPLKRKDGQWRWFLTSAVPICDKEGKVINWFGTNTDIHDQKLAIENLAKTKEQLQLINFEISNKNEELRKTNNDLDNFIYTASHDLKAPISNIEGLIGNLPEVASSEIDKNKEFNQIMEMIGTSINKFKDTIQDLTDITRVQKNISDEETEVDIYEVIENVKSSLRSEIEDSKALIKSALDQCPAIHYSKKNFRSVIYNLLSNAIKYRDPNRKPVIDIQTTQTDEYVLLTVQDNGLGIEPSKMNKAFGMFKRLHDHVEGTGIGLYIVKRIIENTGGKIELESEVGKGTIFKVYFKN